MEESGPEAHAESTGWLLHSLDFLCSSPNKLWRMTYFFDCCWASDFICYNPRSWLTVLMVNSRPLFYTSVQGNFFFCSCPLLYITQFSLLVSLPGHSTIFPTTHHNLFSTSPILQVISIISKLSQPQCSYPFPAHLFSTARIPAEPHLKPPPILRTIYCCPLCAIFQTSVHALSFSLNLTCLVSLKNSDRKLCQKPPENVSRLDHHSPHALSPHEVNSTWTPFQFKSHHGKGYMMGQGYFPCPKHMPKPRICPNQEQLFSCNSLQSSQSSSL